MKVVRRERARQRVAAPGCITIAIVLLLVQLAGAGGARADWTENVINRVLGLQFAQECFTEPKYQRHVHVLGIEAGGVTLPDVERSRMLNTLSDKLGSGTRNRITVAPAFQTIAGSQGAFDTDAVIRMARLDEAARNAEVTILLRPLEVTAKETRLEVVLWANDPSSGTGQYTCVRPFNVAVPIEAPVDPRCLDGWAKATAINSAEGYRFFMSFFGDCPQASEAQAAVTRLDGAACDGAWQQARARGSVDGYRTFVRENPSCTLQVQAANDIIAARANAGGGNSPAVRFTYLPNVDILGRGLDIQELRNVSQEPCEQACAVDSDCAAYNYDSQNRWCWTKRSGGSQIFDPRGFSAIKEAID